MHCLSLVNIFLFLEDGSTQEGEEEEEEEEKEEGVGEEGESEVQQEMNEGGEEEGGGGGGGGGIPELGGERVIDEEDQRSDEDPDPGPSTWATITLHTPLIIQTRKKYVNFYNWLRSFESYVSKWDDTIVWEIRAAGHPR